MGLPFLTPRKNAYFYLLCGDEIKMEGKKNNSNRCVGAFSREQPHTQQIEEKNSLKAKKNIPDSIDFDPPNASNSIQ